MTTLYIDTETTGLILNEALPTAKQPRIIEFAGIRDDDVSFSTLINPGVKLDEVITGITGLTDENLKGAPEFVEVVPDLVRLFLGTTRVVGHNIHFDLMMLLFELRRLDLEHRFPWPFIQFDTVPMSGGKKLEVWARELHDPAIRQTHRAMDDVRMLMRCVAATGGLPNVGPV